MNEIKETKIDYKKTETHPLKFKNKHTAIVDRDEEAFTYKNENFDRSLTVLMSHFIGWLSPLAGYLAFSDWLGHLLCSPGRQADIANKTIYLHLQFTIYVLGCICNLPLKPYFQSRPNDHRFENDLWKQFPFNIYYQYFLMNELIVDDLTSRIHGVTKRHHYFVNFMTRQMLDYFAPSNFILTNPEVLSATFHQGGVNFIKGYFNFLEDVYRFTTKQPPSSADEFQVGKNIAITPGKVIYRNRLIELIQYKPTTSKVYPEPILIVPAWIMKYYILDLSSNNSMVKYLVDQGHTVFMISWKNPTAKDRDLTLSDYVDLGIMSAINVIDNVIPRKKIHAVGYCIGGTLLMIAAAAMAKQSDDRLKTISLFAAQVDFVDAGELLLLADEAQIHYLDDIMWATGYLDGEQMSGTFSMLRATDLVFSRAIHDYLLGSRRPLNDLMAWDYDTTRLPYKMHIEYLRKLFVNNDLVQGRFTLGDSNVLLPDINIPIFSVSTVNDHVAPWKSVYKIHYFTNVEITFVLASGGHNSGIISEPGHRARSYQLFTHKKADIHVIPEVWQENAPYYEGSWWPAWENWLTYYSGEKTDPPSIGNKAKGYNILRDAPGAFVFEK